MWAKSRPEHPAVTIGAPSLSYSQLLTAALEAGGNKSRTVSAMNLATSTELVVRFVAAALSGRTAMVLDAGWPEALQTRLLRRAQEWDIQSSAADPAFLLGLSSGTSGIPKAFIRNKASWQESFTQSCRYFGVSTESITLAPGPLAASMNLYALGESLFAGGRFIGLPRFNPDAAIAAMTSHAVNRLVLVPTVLELIAHRALEKGEQADALKHIVCAGAKLTPKTIELVRQWAPHAVIQQYYGAAELGFVTASVLYPGDPIVVAGGVGRSFPGVQLSIRNTEGHELPSGTLGFVCVTSPYICSGYAWGDDGLAFSELGSGWYTVRDRGLVDGQGNLHLAGRASDMIITSGVNVYPHAVEEVLQGDSSDFSVVVTGIPDEVRGQRVVAACHARAQDGVAQQKIAELRQRSVSLPAAQRPALFFMLTQLPLTGSGKISRKLLTQWISEGDSRVQQTR